MKSTATPSILQQLLQEISFDGLQVNRYRDGGLGMENVLTAEVLIGLDFLPRQHFLGAIIQNLHGNIGEIRTKLMEEVENASVTFLSKRFTLTRKTKPMDRQESKRMA